MRKCPICGERVTYEGLFDIECSGKGCANYRSPRRAADANEYGSWWWARSMQRRGYALEFMLPGAEWENLTDDLTTLDGPDDDGLPRYRLRQVKYAQGSRYRAFTESWARDQTRPVREVLRGYWEIVA